MNPGARVNPSRSTTSVVRAGLSSPGGAIATMRSPPTATSAGRPGDPVPSITFASRSSTSISAPLLRDAHQLAAPSSCEDERVLALIFSPQAVGWRRWLSPRRWTGPERSKADVLHLTQRQRTPADARTPSKPTGNAETMPTAPHAQQRSGSIAPDPQLPRVSDPVQLASILPEDLSPCLRREGGHLHLHALQRVRVQARRVREVGLEEDRVLADRLDELGQLVAVVLEPERRVEVAPEVLRRRLLQRLELLGCVLGHLVVESFEDEGNPPHAAFHRHHLEVRMAIEDARDDRVRNHACIADEEQRAAERQLGVGRLGRPVVLPTEGFRRDACPDMEVHWQLELSADL